MTAKNMAEEFRKNQSEVLNWKEILRQHVERQSQLQSVTSKNQPAPKT